MTGKPAATLLHLGPGLANGLANLHNAQRACSPMVNIVGDHATYHLQYDAPLTTDITSFAKPVSAWIKSPTDAASVPTVAAEAILAARQPPGQIATLILPGDCAWDESVPAVAVAEPPAPPSVDQKRVEEIAQLLRGNESTALIFGGPAAMEYGARLVGRIGQASGARVISRRANSRVQQGAGRPNYPSIPYVVDQAVELLDGIEHAILVGTKTPVAFFAHPEKPSWLFPEGCQIHTLATEDEDVIGALETLAEELHAPADPGPLNDYAPPPLPTGELSIPKIWQAVSALMPEDGVVSDESITSGFAANSMMKGANPHDWLYIMGGAIGQGMPVAIGAAVACPDRKIFNMESDGSAMYTVQSLWTQARENLDIITVMFSNRAYRILEVSLDDMGSGRAWASFYYGRSLVWKFSSLICGNESLVEMFHSRF